MLRPGILSVGVLGRSRGSSGPNGSPSGLTLTVLNGTTMTVSFTGTTGQTGYRAYISTDGSSFTEATTNAATTFNLTGLTAGTRYWVYIKAYKASVESIATNTVHEITYHNELITYITDLTTALTYSKKKALNSFIHVLKTGLDIENLSDAFDQILVLGGETEESSLKNLVSNLFTATAVNSPTFEANAGFNSDGSTSYIDTNYNLVANHVNYHQDNGSIGCYMKKNSGAATFLFGVADDTELTGHGPHTALLSSGTFTRMNNDTQLSNTVTVAVGMNVLSRTASATYIKYTNRTAATITRTSSGVPDSHTMVLLARYVLGITTVNGFSDVNTQMSLFFIGRHFTAAENDVIVDAFNVYLGQGVWEAQGTVKYSAATSDAIVLEPNVIYEGNAQIINTAGNVFKMWFTGGTSPTWHTKYAESLDGKVWVDYPNPVVTGHLRNSIIKVGSVYYLYVNGSDAHIDLYTSNNGVDFTLDTANVLTKGGMGTWDADYIANCSVIIEGATWYMFYDGRNSVTSWSQGVATSADGKTWTKYVSNPIITITGGACGAVNVQKIGTDYYMWILEAAAGALPTDLWRYKSTNLLAWTKNPTTPILVRITTDEGIGVATGQVADPYLLEVNDQVYLYYSAFDNGSTPAAGGHIKLVIADMTFEDLIATNEGNKDAGIP